MQEDVLGPLKELNTEKKLRYTSCDRCGRPILTGEARAGAMRGEEREELCPSCYEDYMKGELLPVDDDEGR
jgi:hypothetical protein